MDDDGGVEHDHYDYYRGLVMFDIILLMMFEDALNFAKHLVTMVWPFPSSSHMETFPFRWIHLRLGPCLLRTK